MVDSKKQLIEALKTYLLAVNFVNRKSLEEVLGKAEYKSLSEDPSKKYKQYLEEALLIFDENKEHLVFNKENISFSLIDDLIDDLIDNRRENNNNSDNTKITSNDISGYLTGLKNKKTEIKNNINKITDKNVDILSFLDNISLKVISEVQKTISSFKVNFDDTPNNSEIKTYIKNITILLIKQADIDNISGVVEFCSNLFSTAKEHAKERAKDVKDVKDVKGVNEINKALEAICDIVQEQGYEKIKVNKIEAKFQLLFKTDYNNITIKPKKEMELYKGYFSNQEELLALQNGGNEQQTNYLQSQSVGKLIAFYVEKLGSDVTNLQYIPINQQNNYQFKDIHENFFPNNDVGCYIIDNKRVFIISTGGAFHAICEEKNNQGKWEVKYYDCGKKLLNKDYEDSLKTENNITDFIKHDGSCGAGAAAMAIAFLTDQNQLLTNKNNHKDVFTKLNEELEEQEKQQQIEGNSDGLEEEGPSIQKTKNTQSFLDVLENLKTVLGKTKGLKDYKDKISLTDGNQDSLSASNKRGKLKITLLHGGNLKEALFGQSEGVEYDITHQNNHFTSSDTLTIPSKGQEKINSLAAYLTENSNENLEIENLKDFLQTSNIKKDYSEYIKSRKKKVFNQQPLTQSKPSNKGINSLPPIEEVSEEVSEEGISSDNTDPKQTAPKQDDTSSPKQDDTSSPKQDTNNSNQTDSKQTASNQNLNQTDSNQTDSNQTDSKQTEVLDNLKKVFKKTKELINYEDKISLTDGNQDSLSEDNKEDVTLDITWGYGSSLKDALFGQSESIKYDINHQNTTLQNDNLTITPAGKEKIKTLTAYLKQNSNKELKIKTLRNFLQTSNKQTDYREYQQLRENRIFDPLRQKKTDNALPIIKKVSEESEEEISSDINQGPKQDDTKSTKQDDTKSPKQDDTKSPKQDDTKSTKQDDTKSTKQDNKNSPKRDDTKSPNQNKNINSNQKTTPLANNNQNYSSSFQRNITPPPWSFALYIKKLQTGQKIDEQDESKLKNHGQAAIKIEDSDNLDNNDYVIPLLVAVSASHNNQNHVDFLLDQTKLKNIKYQDIKYNGNNILHYAVNNKDEELIIKILDQEPNLINIKNNDGNTALHLAVSKKANKLVDLLLGYVADKNIKNDNGYSPLDYAQNISRNNNAEPKQQEISTSEQALSGTGILGAIGIITAVAIASTILLYSSIAVTILSFLALAINSNNKANIATENNNQDSEKLPKISIDKIPTLNIVNDKYQNQVNNSQQATTQLVL
jgi:hypothetical protein